VTRLLTLLVSFAVLAAGCVGGNSIQRTYYSLQYPSGEAAQVYVSARYPAQLRVRRVDTSIAYARQEIVYRSNDYELRYYWYRLWVAKPDKMVGELLTAHLRRSNLFESVVDRIGDTLPDYELVPELLAIEELDSTDGRWFAHLAMRVSLVRFSDNVQVWTMTFDEKKPVYQRDPIFVVKGLSEILEEQMGKVVAGIDAYLAAETGAAAPPRVKSAPVGPAAAPVGPMPDDGDGPAEPKARLKR
jgi:ABC-type uncharacterized transport system auxiliary subunit